MSPQRLLAAYEQGQITTMDCIGRFCKLASEVDPATFASLLPEDWLAEIRELTVLIPRPEELIVIRSACDTVEFNMEALSAREQIMKERNVAGLLVWKAYFDTTSER